MVEVAAGNNAVDVLQRVRDAFRFPTLISSTHMPEEEAQVTYIERQAGLRRNRGEEKEVLDIFPFRYRIGWTNPRRVDIIFDCVYV